MNENTKFWIQTLIIPMVLAVFGIILNSNLETNQQNFERIKITEQIIKDAFELNDLAKANVLISLLPQFHADKEFIQEIDNAVNTYYVSKSLEAAKNGDEETYSKILEDAKAVKHLNSTVFDSIAKNPILINASLAKEEEQKGILLLKKGKLQDAKKAFTKADNLFPGFHSSYEIKNEIEKTLTQINNNNDSAKVDMLKKDLLHIVEEKYSWKIKQDLIM